MNPLRSAKCPSAHETGFEALSGKSLFFRVFPVFRGSFPRSCFRCRVAVMPRWEIRSRGASAENHKNISLSVSNLRQNSKESHRQPGIFAN